MPFPTPTISQIADTVEATCAALASHLNLPPDRVGGTNEPRFGTHAIETPTYDYVITWDADTLQVHRISDGASVMLANKAVDLLGRHEVSTTVIEAVLGRPTIPIESRKMVKRLLELAHTNAAYDFRTGMNYLMQNGGDPEWGSLDIPEMWEAVEEATTKATGHRIRGYNAYHRHAYVAMDAFDIYDEAYIESAFNFMLDVKL